MPFSLKRDACVSVYVPVKLPSNTGIPIGATKGTNITNPMKQSANNTLPPKSPFYTTIIILQIWCMSNFCELGEILRFLFLKQSDANTQAEYRI